MEDAALVGVMDGPATIAISRGRGPGIVGEVPQPLRKAAALDQLHAEVTVPVMPADLVDRHDVRWSRLAAASASGGIAAQLVGQQCPAGSS